MADDNKIKDLIDISKDRFLPKEISDKDPKPVQYSLDTEFAKTAKKGFNWKFYSILFIFLAVVIGGAVFTPVAIKLFSTEESFNIGTNINLSEQLDASKRQLKKVNLAKSELDAINKEKDNEILDIEKDYSKSIEDISKKGLAPDQSKAEIEKLKTEKSAKIDKIDKKYEPKITEAQNKVDETQKEYEEKLAEEKKQTNKAQSIIDNYKKLQKMQIDKLAQLHRAEMASQKLKYNPYFYEPELRKITQSMYRKKVLDKPILEDISALTLNHVITDAELNAIRSKITEYQKVLQRMQKIPYTNSVAPALDAVQNDSYFLITEYERIMRKMLKNLEILQKYQQAFNQIAEFSVDSGIVIDATNSTDVIYILKPVVQVSDGDTGLVFRQSDEYIGTMIFELKSGKLMAKIIDMAPDQTMHPLDKIFIQKKKEEIIQKPEDEQSENVKPSDDVKPNEENTDQSENTGNPQDNTENNNKEVAP